MPFSAVTVCGPPIDASIEVTENMPLFPGDPTPEFVTTASLTQGDAVELSEMRLGCHVGTHLDAPAHFVLAGKTVDELSVDGLCGRVVVVDCTGVTGPIEQTHLAGVTLTSSDHLVLRTRSRASAPETGDLWLAPSTARWIISRGITLLGIDRYSVDRVDDMSLPAHRLLATHQVSVVVMLNLLDVPCGVYFWVVAPLRLLGREASPARVLFFPARFER